MAELSPSDVSLVLSHLLALWAAPHWQTRMAALTAAKYLVAARTDLAQALASALLPTALQGLEVLQCAVLVCMRLGLKVFGLNLAQFDLNVAQGGCYRDVDVRNVPCWCGCCVLYRQLQSCLHGDMTNRMPTRTCRQLQRSACCR